jgi:hypothetical protein
LAIDSIASLPQEIALHLLEDGFSEGLEDVWGFSFSKTFVQ